MGVALRGALLGSEVEQAARCAATRVSERRPSIARTLLTRIVRLATSLFVIAVYACEPTFSATATVAGSSDAPGLLLLETVGSNEVSIADNTEARLQFNLTLRNASTTSARDVRIYLTDFRNAQLKAFETRVDGKTGPLPGFELSASESRVLAVSVALPEPGIYTARLLVTAGPQKLDIPIKVARTTPTSSLEIAPLQSAAIAVAPFAGGEFKQDLEVRRTAGGDTSIVARLRQLLYVPKDGVEFAIPSSGLTSPPSGAIHVSANQTTKVPLAFAIPHAGVFKAQVEYELKDATTKTHSVTLYARESRWLAIVFILLGVLIAFVIRQILTVFKPRSQIAQRIALCLQRLREAESTAASDPIALAVIARVRANVQQRWDEYNRSSAITAPAELEAAESKAPLLEHWMRLRALAADFPEAVRKNAQATLNETQFLLENPLASKNDVQQQLDKLGKLPGEINKQATDFAIKTIQELASQLTADPTPAAKMLREELMKLASRLEKSEETLPSVFAKLNELRLTYVGILANSLIEQVNGEPPVAMEPALWIRIRQTTQSDLDKALKAKDADAALADYLSAVRSYAHPLVLRLKVILAQRIAANDPQKTLYESLHTRAAALYERIGKNEPAPALKETAQLINDFDELEYAGLALLDANALSRAGVKRAPAALSADLENGQSFLDLRTFGRMGDEAMRVGLPKDARWRTMLLTTISVALSLLITLLLGVHTLWNNDWAWGGVSSYLLAILWGAGVYGFSFEGISGLINRFKA